LGADVKDEVEIDRGTCTDAELEAGDDGHDESNAEINKNGNRDGEDERQAEGSNSLDLRDAEVDGGLDLESNGDDDVNIDLDGSVDGDVQEVRLDPVESTLASADCVVDSGNITGDESLSLHGNDILHDGSQTAGGDDGIAASNETSFTGSRRRQGEGSESSNAENEEGLDGRHVD